MPQQQPDPMRGDQNASAYPSIEYTGCQQGTATFVEPSELAVAIKATTIERPNSASGYRLLVVAVQSAIKTSETKAKPDLTKRKARPERPGFHFSAFSITQGFG